MSYGNKEVLKVILLGNGGVGKSSLMRRYVNNVFEEKTLHTIGVEFLNKDVDFNNKTFTLQVKTNCCLWLTEIFTFYGYC